MKTYFQITKSGKSADIDIYGDITAYKYFDNDVNAYDIKNQIKGLDVETINVHINSCGGDVFESLAICSALKQHKAKITTYCDGLCASAASIIFCIGDNRIMSDLGMLLIHNAWTIAQGNANDLRKQADDLEKVTEQSISVYESVSNLTHDEIIEMLDAETFLNAKECIEYGFATSIYEEEKKGVNQSVKAKIKAILLASQEEEKQDEEENEEEKQIDLEEFASLVASKVAEIMKSKDEEEDEETETSETDSEDVPSEEETETDEESEEEETEEDENKKAPCNQSWDEWFK